MGLFQVSEGILTVNGKLLSSYPLELLRGLMAYVPRDAYLFDGTIEENIRYGKPDASSEELMAAARLAHAHEFILDQPDGYDTLGGEWSANLSGRQRQKIAIAYRLSTFQHVDNIYLMQARKVVEEGTHASLLTDDGLFKEQFALQGIQAK